MTNVRENKRVQVCLSISKLTDEKIDELASALGCTRSAVIDRVVERYAQDIETKHGGRNDGKDE